jgi:hypothetical protein
LEFEELNQPGRALRNTIEIKKAPLGGYFFGGERYYSNPQGASTREYFYYMSK